MKFYLEAQDIPDNFINDILRLPGLKVVHRISLSRSQSFVEKVLLPIFSSVAIRSVNDLELPFSEVCIYVFVDSKSIRIVPNG